MDRYAKSLLSLILMLPVFANGADAGNTIVVPEKENVGAAAMPAGIAPVDEAPFKLKKIRRPEFPDRRETVGKADISASGKITPAINEKIERLSKRGGGTVVVPAGKWYSGRIELKSNVELCLDEGAVIEFSGEVDDYQPAVFTRHEGVEVMGAGAFIYANGAKNIALTGKGVIMGPPMDVPMRKFPNGKSVVENDIDYHMPVKERLCDGKEGRTFYRPKSFSPINCKNVLVEGVTFERSLLWNVNPVYCENVIIRGITVNSTDVPSGDGIDISSCKNVLIEYSTLNCGDDCFTLKAGRMHWVPLIFAIVGLFGDIVTTVSGEYDYFNINLLPFIDPMQIIHKFLALSPMAIAYALLNGFYEEFFFLGVMTSVNQKYKWWALAYSTLIRISFHTYQGLLWAVVIGVIYGLFYYVLYKKVIKNLLPFFLMHALADMFGSSILYLLINWGG